MVKKFAIAQIMLCLSLTISILPTCGRGFAKDAAGFAGWEAGSAYNKLYNPREMDSLKGRVAQFKTVTPMKGMAPGTAFLLDEGEDEKTLVHLCPEAYARSDEVGFKRGDKVKVKGSWVEIDGEFVFVASKVKKGDNFEFKVRLTSDGTPFWTMSAGQLAKERKP